MKSIILLFILLYSHTSFAQRNIDFTDHYKEALIAIVNGDTAKAQDLFFSSVSEFDDAPSYYQLALIFQFKNTLNDLNIARENIKKAIERNEENLMYHLTFASILEKLYLLSEFEFDARSRAILEYEKILDIDSTFSFAWYKLGKYKRDDYLEFSGSYLRTGESRQMDYKFEETEEFAALDQVVSGTTQLLSDNKGTMTESETRNLQALNSFIDSNSPLISYEGVAEEDYADAEYFLKKAIETNPRNYAARVELGLLYEDGDQPELAIPYFEEIIEDDPVDKNAHLFLGLLYYETGDLDNSYESFQNALSLMNKKEFKDYTFYSALKLLEPILGDRIRTFTNAEMIIFIEAYWKVRDPFNLNDYNERILEHYARVAYSNFRYGIPNRGISGWQTDMGEMMIRFGEPPVRKRFRRGVTTNDFAYYDLNAINYDYLSGNNVKTEVWYYDNVAIAFTDDYSTGNYKYHDPYAHARTDYTGFGVNDGVSRNLVNSMPEVYKPKFNGIVIDIPYSAVQFRGSGGRTDVFVNYGLPVSQSRQSGGFYFENHKTGLFFYDRLFRAVSEDRKTISSIAKDKSISLNDSLAIIVNTLQMSLKPQRGNCAFELQRTSDRGVASFHGKYNVKNFSGDSLMLSDILVASDVQPVSGSDYSLKRKDYAILPNPGHSFSARTNFFLYYEIYNLQKNSSGLTDFVQSIEVHPFEEEEETIFGAIGSFFELFGIGGEDKIELTSNYQTTETDPQIYFQLDMTDYEPGKYLVVVTVKDNISQREKRVQSLINWQ